MKNISENDNNTANVNNSQKNEVRIKGPDFFSYLKIILVLTFVIFIIYGISYLLKRYLKIKGSIGDEAIILSNQSLGPGKWLQVVYIGGKYLVLGVTNDSIHLLTEIIDTKEIERFEIKVHEKQAQEGGTFMDVLTDFFKNKLKKKFNKQNFDYETDAVDFLKQQKDRIDKMNQ